MNSSMCTVYCHCDWKKIALILLPNKGWEFALWLIRSLLFCSNSWANCSCRSIKKSDVSDSLVFRANRLQKPSKLLKIFVFLVCFWLFQREAWTIPFRCSLLKSELEQFAQIAHDKRAMGAIHSFSQGNRSFAHKKTRESLEKLMSEFPTLS